MRRAAHECSGVNLDVKSHRSKTLGSEGVGKYSCRSIANVFVSKKPFWATRPCSMPSKAARSVRCIARSWPSCARSAPRWPAPATRRAGRRPSRTRYRARGRRSPGAAGNLSRPDRAVREAQGRARPHSRRDQPHQARNRDAARQELRRRGNGQGQWRTRRRRRRHRTGHPADPRSRRGDRPGRHRAVQEHLARPAEAAQRGNPGTRRLDLRGLQLPGPHRPAHQQGDDHDEVHREAHQRR